MASAAGVLNFVAKQLGDRYRLGAVGPDQWDCSSVVQAAYASEGVKLPRLTYEQVKCGVAIPKDRAALRDGDLIFSNWIGRKNSHVALYAGNNRILVASSAVGKVCYEILDNSYWAHVDAIRRVLVTAPTVTPYVPKWPGRVFVYDGKPEHMMHGQDIWTWQNRMHDRGWRLKVDGWYGKESRAVCFAFQEEKKLLRDGKVGRETWGAAWTAPVT